MEPMMQDPRGGGDRDAAPRRASPSAMDELLDRWVRGLEGGAAHASREAPVRRAEPPRTGEQVRREPAAPAAVAGAPGGLHPAAAPRLRLDERLIALPDCPAERVAIGARGSRIVHSGTISARGPRGPAREEVRALGLSEAEVEALRFVADWFGAPLDAVNARRRGHHPLALGCWHLSGEAVSECLAAWKRRAPETFAKRLAALGVDVDGPPDAPRLLARPAEGIGVAGEEAADAIATDPRLVAVLSRCGRDREGQLSQLETIVRRSLRPALAAPLAQGGPPLGEVLRSTRGIALALHADLVFGVAGPRHLAAALQRVPAPPPDAGDPDVEPYLELLARSGCAAELDQALRILTSPELSG